jgi:hypothetical protein
MRAAAALVVALGAGGCSLLIGAQLSGKPAETTGAGGSGGEAGATTGAHDTTGAGTGGMAGTTGIGTGGTEAGMGGDRGSGGSAPTCPEGTADCDGNPANGCETDLKHDPKNCGACGHTCGPPAHCAGGSCK